MAIPLPAAVRITRAPMRLVVPGQNVLRSPYTGDRQVFSPGPGYYTGRHVISDIGETINGVYHAPRRLMESFLNRLHGVSGVMELPVCRPAEGPLAAGTALSVTSASIVSGVVVVVAANASAGGLLRGDLVSIGNRLYELAADMTATGMSLIPAVIPAASAEIRWEDVKVRASLTEQSAGDIGAHNPDFSGPWTLEWVEAF